MIAYVKRASPKVVVFLSIFVGNVKGRKCLSLKSNSIILTKMINVFLHWWTSNRLVLLVFSIVTSLFLLNEKFMYSGIRKTWEACEWSRFLPSTPTPDLLNHHLWLDFFLLCFSKRSSQEGCLAGSVSWVWDSWSQELWVRSPHWAKSLH